MFQKKTVRIMRLLLMMVLLTSASQAACGSSNNANDAQADVIPFENKITQEAYTYFTELLKIPRCSGNEQAVSDYLVSFGQEHGLEVIQDSALNVMIRKPGSEGREDEPPVILQAHMDMVCQKTSDVEHDFLKDPIIPIIDGDWVKADRTTLGADDGGGLSIIMAILASDELSHPQVEAIFTTDEEVGMVGAKAFDLSVLKGSRFINLDSETEGVFTVSSASSVYIQIPISIETETSPEGLAAYKLMVKGLAGGHSGVDIDKGHANANILTANLLNLLENIRIASINGGSARNAIPRECEAIILFDESNFTQIEEIVKQAEADYKTVYLSDVDLTVTLEKTDAISMVMSSDSQERVIRGILEMPNGVYSMSPSIDGLVQTSNNLGIVETDEETVKLTNYLRSSSFDDENALIEKIKEHADSIGARAEIAKQYPVWEYREASPLREKLIMVFTDMYGYEPVIEAIHAGLECALFVEKMPDVDIIAIGMDIVGAHSPDERMSISSYDRTYDFLVRLLEEL